MKVSVLMTTYNQDRFIAQAIDSVLTQQVNFDYEIVIGEDASTDRTPEIVSEFQRSHPDKIRVLLRDAAVSERDRVRGLGGKTNFMEGLQQCRGEYLALLDGDDYWTSSNKLQKQVDFLEGHPEYALCFHNARVVREDGGIGPDTFCSPDQKQTSTLEDLLIRNFIFTGSIMFRNRLFGTLPDWFYTARMGDWPLHILNAQYGKIGYLNEVMAVYRVHHSSFWTATNELDQFEDNIRILDHLLNHLDDKYKRQARAAKAKSCQCLSELYLQRGDVAKARSFLLESLKICLSNKSLPNWQLLKRLIKLQTFRSYEWLRLRFTGP